MNRQPPQGGVTPQQLINIDSKQIIQKYSHRVAVPHDDARIVYAGTGWENLVRSTAITGTNKTSKTENDTATLAFTGNFVGVVLETSAHCGIAEILIDGISQGNFDCYSEQTYYPWVYFTKNLLNGEHTVQVKVTNTKNESSDTPRIFFDHFFYDVDRYDIVKPQQSGVILTFDDTRPSVYTYGVPKLEEHGFKGTCYINPGVALSKTVTSNSSLDRWKIYFLRVHDFEVTSHSYLHINLTTLTEDEIRTSLRQATEWLHNENFESAHFSAPENATNATALAVIKEFHATCSVGGNVAFDRYNFNPYAMPRYGVDESTDLTALKAVLDNVKLNNSVITLYFHSIVDGVTTAPNISKTKFDEVIDYIASIGLTGMRMKDFLPL